jgi:hypothetical protein
MYSYLLNHAIKFFNHFAWGFQDYRIKRKKINFLATCLHQSLYFGVD